MEVHGAELEANLSQTKTFAVLQEMSDSVNSALFKKAFNRLGIVFQPATSKNISEISFSEVVEDVQVLHEPMSSLRCLDKKGT